MNGPQWWQAAAVIVGMLITVFSASLIVGILDYRWRGEYLDSLDRLILRVSLVSLPFGVAIGWLGYVNL